MNANNIITDDMTLEEKFAMINQMTEDPIFQEEFNKANGRPLDTPVDPQDALNCEGCQ